MQALLLGNGPSCKQVDLEHLDRSQTTVFAVNRILGLIVPDYLCIIDSSIEERWIPKPGEVKGLLTYASCPLSAHPDALCHALKKHKACEEWPRAGDPFLNARNSGTFCFQWVVEMGFDDIGILGIEYSHSEIWLKHGKKQDTHWYGHNSVTKRSPAFASGRDFWRLAREHCSKAGIMVHNLCPYPVPFDEAGFPKSEFSEWCAGLPFEPERLPQRDPSPTVVPGSFKAKQAGGRQSRKYEVRGRRPVRVRRLR